MGSKAMAWCLICMAILSLAESHRLSPQHSGGTFRHNSLSNSGAGEPPGWVFPKIMRASSSSTKNHCDDKFKIPPLQQSAPNLDEWCNKEWPGEGVEEPMQLPDDCEDPQMVTEADIQDLADPETDIQIHSAYGYITARSRAGKMKAGGINNHGIFLLDIETLSDDYENSSSTERAPDRSLGRSDSTISLNLMQMRATTVPLDRAKPIVLKLNKDDDDWARERECFRGIASASVRGVPKLFGNSFKMKGKCFKATIMEFLEGKLWSDLLAKKSMTPKDECILQETAGRIMCGIGKHGVMEKDWNNPGNWMVKQNPQTGDREFTKFDFGFCEFRKADMAPMWVVNNGPIRMGMEGLLLNSQDRIRKKIEKIDVQTVSFVGSFSRPAFNLKDPKYRGQTTDGETYTLKLEKELKPGNYKLKVVLNGDLALSYGVAGRMDVEDEIVKFMVKHDGGKPVFSFNTKTDEITVTDSNNGEALTCDDGVTDCYSISFPGDYLESNSMGQNWNPADPSCVGTTKDGDHYTLDVWITSPGTYEFKVALNMGWEQAFGHGPEKKDPYQFYSRDSKALWTLSFSRKSQELNAKKVWPVRNGDPTELLRWFKERAGRNYRTTKQLLRSIGDTVKGYFPNEGAYYDEDGEDMTLTDYMGPL